MSLYFGDNAVAGLNNSTIVTGFNILEHKWSDHILNDIQWLRADTFSWQDGSVYVTAYNHLLADILNITAETETIGSYTVTFYRADDGHKICLADQETTVANIYTETGIAWYYIIDTDNIRFKLPRDNAKHGELIEKYSSGTEWYRVYSDGWCEQGGFMSDSSATTPFLKNFLNTNYTVMLTPINNNNLGSARAIKTKTTSSFTITDVINANWQACGYISTPTNQYLSEYKYLYFYVGEYSKTAVEQTAGITSEELNNKIDVENLVLLDGSLSMPSSKYIDLTLGSSGATYTAPANGWVLFCRRSGNSAQYLNLYNTTSKLYFEASAYATNNYLCAYLPIMKGDIFQTNYNASGSDLIFRFIYAEADA